MPCSCRNNSQRNFSNGQNINSTRQNSTANDAALVAALDAVMSNSGIQECEASAGSRSCNCGPGRENTINCNTGCPNGGCSFEPIERKCVVSRSVCCDQNGCCGLYPDRCRNTFWPSFAHPRWLSCNDLYCIKE